MFESIINFFKKAKKKEEKQPSNSKNAAKERLHLVLMQDRANVSADFLELMKQEIIEVIKKYIDVDEAAIDVRLTNQSNDDGTNGAPALYANIPIINIKDEVRKTAQTNKEKEEKVEKEESKEQETENNKSNDDRQEEKILEDSKDNKDDKDNDEVEEVEVVEELEAIEEVKEDNAQEHKEEQESKEVESKK